MPGRVAGQPRRGDFNAVECEVVQLDSPDVDACLELWNETRGGRAKLINLSENHTYRIDGTDGLRHILRVHRPGYQTLAAIRSELAWVAALRKTGLPLPRVLPGRDGEFVQNAAGRFAVLFAFEEGREPHPEEDLTALFGTLGGFAAAAHRHVQAWTPPPGFERPHWTETAILDAEGLWGDWRQAPGLAAGTRRTLDELDARLRQVLRSYGRGPDRYGLIHADMRLANLLVGGGRVTLIDFDDCGFGWFLYDLAASLSFIETTPQAATLKRSWIEGYTASRALSADDLEMVDAMVLLRRMALLAWIGSHGETELAALHRDRFAAETAALAEAWMT